MLHKCRVVGPDHHLAATRERRTLVRDSFLDRVSFLSPTDVAGISRMTVVIDSDQVSADRVTAYLYKLVNVLQVEDLGEMPSVARDLALVKVAVAGHDRAHLLRVVDETRAHIVDSGEQTMTLEITGEPPHVDAVISRLEPLGIVEMVRTGRVAMRRGDTTLSAAQYS